MEEQSGHFLLGIWQVFGRGLFLVAGYEGQVIYMYVGYVLNVTAQVGPKTYGRDS